jgi:LmbE family N-acetylglucosaminyl deacetylase
LRAVLALYGAHPPILLDYRDQELSTADFTTLTHDVWRVMVAVRPEVVLTCGPTGIATVVADAATRRGLPVLTVRGPVPHYLQGATNPAVSRALLTTVARLLDLELDVTPFEATVRAFRTQCDQAVAKDAAVRAYVRQLEQDYDTPGDEALRPRQEDDFNPEQLMHELEDFLRQERDKGAE